MNNNNSLDLSDINDLDYYHCNTDEKLKIEATKDDFSDDELVKEVGKVLSLTADTDRSFDAFVLSEAENHLLDLS